MGRSRRVAGPTPPRVPILHFGTPPSFSLPITAAPMNWELRRWLRLPGAEAAAPLAR